MCGEEPHKKSCSAPHSHTKNWGCNICLSTSCYPPLSLTAAQWPRYNAPMSQCYAACVCSKSNSPLQHEEYKTRVGDIVSKRYHFWRTYKKKGGALLESLGAPRTVLDENQPSFVSWMSSFQVMIGNTNAKIHYFYVNTVFLKVQ